jgi:hypothetical protein
METSSVILISLIAQMILQPILTFMINSRCKKIDCCCIHLEREVLPEIELDEPNNKV